MIGGDRRPARMTDPESPAIHRIPSEPGEDASEQTEVNQVTQLGVAAGLSRPRATATPASEVTPPNPPKPTTSTAWPQTRRPAPGDRKLRAQLRRSLRFAGQQTVRLVELQHELVPLQCELVKLQRKLADLQAALERSEEAREDAQRTHADVLADLCARDRKELQASAVLARAFDVAARAITGMSAVELAAQLDSATTTGSPS